MTEKIISSPDVKKEMNFKEKICYYGGLFLLILFAVFIFSFWLAPPASAEDTGGISLMGIKGPSITPAPIETINSTQTQQSPSKDAINTTSMYLDEKGDPFPIYNSSLSILNGGCVPINSTVDISSIGWGVPRLTYYGPYYTAFSPMNKTPLFSISLPNTASKLRKFYIAPDTFFSRRGYWYQDYDDPIDASGNLRMFYVNETCPPKPIIEQFNITINLTKMEIPEKKPYLPSKKEATILLARGDYTAISKKSPIHWWLFGFSQENIIYDRESTANTLTLNASDFDGKSTGNYYLDIIRPGENKILEEYYDPAFKPLPLSNYTYPAIMSPFRSISPKNIEKIKDPQIIRKLLQESVKKSIDDSFEEITVSYMEPEIQIKRIDALLSPSNKTYYNIRGYTNVQNGSILTITIDLDLYNSAMKKDRRWTTIAESINNDAGEWQQFNALIPVDYTKIFPGQHWITITSETGASQTVGIYIYQELPPHYIPPEYIEYTGVSPFITPKIIIQEKMVPGPKQIVEKFITPSQQEIKDAGYAYAMDWTIGIVIILICIILVIGAGYYLISLARRTIKRMRKP